MPVNGEHGIFEALYQWGRVKEDFYSNSLVYILKQLKRSEKGKRLSTNFLDSLLNGKLNLTSDDWDIRDHTGKDDRPDIEIESSQILAFIEVKVGSSVRLRQLRNYLGKLKEKARRKGKKPTLFLLTAFGWDDDKEIPDLQVSWVKVWEYLGSVEKKLQPKINKDKAIPGIYYLVRDFRLFLKENGMGVERITRTVSEKGLDDLRKFLAIVRSGCIEAGLSLPWDLGYWWEGDSDEKAIGWYFNKGRKTKNYWCGFYLDNPKRVCFAFAKDARKALFTRIEKDDNLKRKLNTKFPGWWRGEEWIEFSYDLPENFVRRSAEDQVRVISDFVKEILNATKEVTKKSV